MVEKEAYILGFDQYYYRKMIDLCVDYCKVYRDLGLVPSVPQRLSNMFVTILDFAHNCVDFPDHLRNPPLTEWNMYGVGVRDPLVIYPVCGIRYVMSVMNEILRQQGDKTLTEEDFDKALGEDNV